MTEARADPGTEPAEVARDLEGHPVRRERQLLSRRLAGWVDDRFGAAHFATKALGKVFPDHFSFLFGEIALYCFVTLIGTGIFLTFFFEPSSRDVVYQGRYSPLFGQHMTAAYYSTIKLSFDVRMGLLFRQIHHWAALVFAAAIVAHMARIFFTGAFRRPRELNWMVGVTLLVLVIFNGFAGYSLLDDLLSGTGLRIAYSMVQSIPLVGDTLAFWVWGGEYPGHSIITRLFIVHVLILPGLILLLLSLHLASVWRQTHTQFAGEGRSDRNIVGSRLWPTYTARSISLFLGVVALLGLLGGVFQVNPVWLYGPYEPSTVSTAAQPDWYMGWLEGALRLFPAWEIRVGNYMVASPFFPGVLLPALTFLALYAWPFIEARVTGDRAEHHAVQQPRDRPGRTALGAGAFSFYVVLFVAGGNDVIAARLGVSVNAMTWGLRIAAIVLPFVVAAITWKLCADLRAGGSDIVDGSELVPEDSADDRPRRLAAAAAGATAAPTGAPIPATAESAGTESLRDRAKQIAESAAGLALAGYLRGRSRRRE